MCKFKVQGKIQKEKVIKNSNIKLENLQVFKYRKYKMLTTNCKNTRFIFGRC